MDQVFEELKALVAVQCKHKPVAILAGRTEYVVYVLPDWSDLQDTKMFEDVKVLGDNDVFIYDVRLAISHLVDATEESLLLLNAKDKWFADDWQMLSDYHWRFYNLFDLFMLLRNKAYKSLCCFITDNDMEKKNRHLSDLWLYLEQAEFILENNWYPAMDELHNALNYELVAKSGLSLLSQLLFMDENEVLLELGMRLDELNDTNKQVDALQYMCDYTNYHYFINHFADILKKEMVVSYE